MKSEKNMGDESQIVLSPWNGDVNSRTYSIHVSDPFVSAKELLKEIKRVALSLGFEDWTHGKRENAVEFLILKKRTEEHSFVTIERRRGFYFPFRTYLKAWADENVDRGLFEIEFKELLDAIKR